METFCIHDPFDSEFTYFFPIKSGEDIDKKIYAFADKVNRMDVPLHVFDVKIKPYIEINTGISGRLAIYSVRLTSSEPIDSKKLDEVANKIEQQWTQIF